MKIGRFFSPDCSGNPFLHCLGLKPEAMEKRLQRKAGIASKHQQVQFDILPTRKVY
jgi:hypothetical protein